MKRRQFVKCCAALAAGMPLLSPVAAQEVVFPVGPIRLIVPTTAGTNMDAVARMFAERVSAGLKQPVVVQNMPGGRTLIATRQVANAAPNGYTLIIAANTIVAMPHLDKRAGYQVKDFVGVSELTRTPTLLVVSSSSKIKSVSELVDAAKKAPGRLTFASVGIGTTTHLTGEVLARSAGISVRLVAYQGSSAAMPDLITGRVDFMMATSAMDLVHGGKLRALAIASESRSPALPDVPTLEELGYPNTSYTLFMGILAPAGTPDAIRSVLAQAFEAAKKDPKLRNRLAASGQAIPDGGGAESFDAVLRTEEKKSIEIIKAANIQL